jgi:hypothetical protein
MSAIARCAATPRTCDSENAVAASTRWRRRGQRQRHQQVAPLADHVVDQEFRGGRKHETGKPVDQHQHQTKAEPATMGPHQFPGFGPGVRDVGLPLLTHLIIGHGKWLQASGFWLESRSPQPGA